MDHPKDAVTAENWKDLAVGEVSTAAKRDGEWIISRSSLRTQRQSKASRVASASSPPAMSASSYGATVSRRTASSSTHSRPISRSTTWPSLGLAELESYGAMVPANPDFVERIASNAPLNTADHRVFFGVGADGPASGYTDFATLGDSGIDRDDRFQAMVRLKIRDGKLDEFKRIATDSIALSREKDTGTIRYDIFLNNDETEAVVYEEFANPASRLEHLANLSENVGAMLAITDMQAEVWSHSDEELRASTKGYNVSFPKPFLRMRN